MIARILYGSLFVIVLPAFLTLWAYRLEPVVTLSSPQHTQIGISLIVLGVVFMGLGTRALWVYGGGLPMNAFPPPRYVKCGIYRYFSQPIYIGFVIACAGASVLAGSRAGFWVVTPLVAAGCAALVLGYERHDLQRRFGTQPQPLVRLCSDGSDPPDFWERLSVYPLLFLPWLILYEAIGYVQPGDVVETYFGFERSWPVMVWGEVPYLLTYPYAMLAPLVAGTRSVLRRFALAGMAATVIGSLAYVALPLVAPPRAFEGGGLLGDMLRLERVTELNGYASCPSFHVAWAFLATWVYVQRWPSLRWAWWLLALIMAASCVMTGMHSLIDIPAGILLAALAYGTPPIWRRSLTIAEWVANSWREWRVGPVRIINHGLYAGSGALVGVTGAGILAGAKHVPFLIGVALTAALGAALVGQLLVGSKTLLRPFGYFGCVLGSGTGLALAAALGADFWSLAAATAVMAPWVHLIGRFRCLVQGCCHGAPTLTGWGICYRRPESRVCRIAHLCGVPIYPTPLFSMLGNVVIGILLGRMWHADAPLPLIVGLYLVLAGLARFVEESYRGEPQTPIPAGLRLYQWFAMISVAVGAVLMSLQTVSSAPEAELNWLALIAGVLTGVAWWFAMGVDFPHSNRRFARLA